MSRRKRVKVGKTEVRSGFEAKLLKQLKATKTKFGYESTKIKYVVPERVATYTPDFVLKNGIIIEAKGKFTSADRKKMILVRDQNPELDIRLVFMRDNKISKVSKTTYSMWSEKNGFDYAIGEIPESWT